MIGSLMSRMGMAEKLSVAQLQKAVQDGTLPAYVGVPLIQDKMQKEQAAKATAAGIQQGQPPIAQQVLQQAEAQQGVEALPTNLPEQGFAGGGIIAFAEGGEADDDEEDFVSDEDRQQAELLSLMRAGEDRLQQGVESGEGFGIDYAARGASEGMKAPKGLEELKAYILNKESRGRRYDDKGSLLTSPKGAQGEMQVMPGTARDPGFGIKAARDRSPEELRRVGDEYVAALYNEFGDPKLAAMAYNWGPGNVKKWLAGGMKGEVPAETQKYVAQLAKGGEVKRYDLGGFVDSLVQTPIQHVQSAGNTYSQNPEQAALGINTPAEAYLWNSALGTSYKPTVNMFGGPSETAYAEGAKNGVNMQAGHVADSVAPAVIGAVGSAFGGPAGGMAASTAASTANSMGKGYELNQMRGDYLRNPTAFQQQYGMVKGVNYAGGGIVALADGGDVYSPEGIMVSGPDTTFGETPSMAIGKLFNPEYTGFNEAEWEKKYGKKKPAAQEVKKEVKKDVDSDIAAKVAQDLSKDEGIKAIAPTAPAAPEDDIKKKYLEMLTKREAESANQRSIDNYTALLQAGLGMMASKSLTPLGAIGEGASSGIAAKMAAEKTRAAEEAATLKGYGNLYTAEQAAAMRKTLAGQGQEAALRKQQFGVMANLEQRTRAQIAASLDKSIDATGMTPEQKQAKVDQLTAQTLGKMDAYKAAYKAYNGFDYTSAPVVPAAVDYSATYGLTPKPKQ